MRTRILVVDDDKPIRALLAKTLNEMGGFSVEEAETAEEALQKIEGVEFDLVLADLKLPGMDGLQLITQIVNSKPEILTILVTGHGSIDSAVEAIKRGASDYLIKPFGLEEMLTRVNRVLEEKKRFVSIRDHSKGCLFSWEKLKEMKDNQTEFWAGDGFTRLRIVEVSDREGVIHMITTEGKLTWPLKFQKLEEVHNRVHRREMSVLAYEIEKYIPTWGNYVSGLLRYLGCDRIGT
jgi:DNA-binding response OmpR family regulator